jgi:hypothetical protein
LSSTIIIVAVVVIFMYNIRNVCTTVYLLVSSCCQQKTLALLPDQQLSPGVAKQHGSIGTTCLCTLVPEYDMIILTIVAA